MTPRYDLVIFDLDGTLMDTGEGVIDAARYTIEHYGLPMPDEQTLSTFVGPPIQNSFANTFGLPAETCQEMAVVFRTFYSQKTLLKAVPYDGIFTLFEALQKKGIATAVATYKREDYALTLLSHFGFDRYSKILHGADNENKLTKRDIIEICIKESGVTDKSRIVMVGDTAHDAKGAFEMGVDFLGVTFGFGFRAEADMKEYPYAGYSDTPMGLLPFITGEK